MARVNMATPWLSLKPHIRQAFTFQRIQLGGPYEVDADLIIYIESDVQTSITAAGGFYWFAGRFPR